MTITQMDTWQDHMGVAKGEEWDPFATVSNPKALHSYLNDVPFFAQGHRRYQDATLPVPALAAPQDCEISTQIAFGKILDGLAKTLTALSDMNRTVRSLLHHPAVRQPPGLHLSQPVDTSRRPPG